jgi:hypothetical protein
VSTGSCAHWKRREAGRGSRQGRRRHVCRTAGQKYAGPSGQHGACVGDADPAAQKYPGAHGPTQVLAMPPGSSPYVPGGHGNLTPLVQ